MQVRLYRWQQANFGTSPQTNSQLGVGEELGELIEGMFSSHDVDTGHDPFLDNPMINYDPDSVKDALGDVWIYATQVCTNCRLDFGVLWDSIWSASQANSAIGPLLGMAVSVGRLNHAALKSSQRIRGYDDQEKLRRAVAENVARLCHFGRKVAQAVSIDADAAYFDTAESVVLKRNWRADATAGGA
jgi:hypothetical protein